MVNITINHQAISVPDGTTIMEAAKLIGIEIPKLCFLKDINEIGACRVCVVELVGKRRLITACNNEVKEGMEILTNSPKVRESRKNTVQLLLSEHDFKCATCVRSKNCTLQDIANNLGLVDLPFQQKVVKKPWSPEFPLQRDSSKCVKCMRCVQICEKVQGLNIWDVANTGSRTDVDVSLNRKIEDADCALCGQCITHCPVGALSERDDTSKAFKAFADPDKVTVVQIAPAVRAAWGESLGLSREEATVEKIITALRMMGADYVFDTVFTADLTIMEEGNEFLKRLTEGDLDKYPMFTSCCPGWIRFIKSQYPEMVPQLSTAKSPQQMFGATTKTYFADKLGIDPEKIFCISIMPCTAKKGERTMELYYKEFAGNDVDLVLTTRELDRMIKRDYINPKTLTDGTFDDPLKVGTGAGVIFGATGGVMEAALRSAYYLVTGKNPKADAFANVRGMEGWKEATFDINGIEVKVAVVSGLGNTRKLMNAIKRGEVKYHFVEVMACPGGCVGGGGQPIHEGQELANVRGANLYFLDQNAQLRFSHENPSVLKAYEEYFGEPLSHKSHSILHTDHFAWDMPLAPKRR
ncbi:MAG: [FeFe] hydrogenase, group A [Lachnospiraceae bacterium]|nr:[FeFe] hydrogenase, group A [Lachnospiraceae bacterium]